MKIGILTFHYSINPGSVIQAYCVYHLLKNGFPNAKVEIINLIPANREKIERDFFSKKPPFIRHRKIIRYNSVRKFIKNYLPFSEFCNQEDLTKQIEFINKQAYDLIFTGSDTVWMHSDKFDYQLPNIYFLPKGIKAKKASIAASVDPLKDDNEFFNHKHMLSQILNEYKIILVRDSATFNLLKKMGVKKTNQIADPTFLYDFEKDLKLVINKSPDIKKKNVLIGVTDKYIAQNIKSLLKDHSDQYLFIQRKKSLSLFDDHIIDQLNVYSKIDILITDRFHGSIFAMKLSNTLVINIERYNKNPHPNGKGRDLFTRIGIPEYCIRLDRDNQEEFRKNLLGLIDHWDRNAFLRREDLLKDFIHANKAIWQSSLAHLSQETDLLEEV
ncbi:polysaccharide pyruvyl transferase family protein [Echinicola marina]|uniref:polysaccharide pyruvyl transferase family protein n=1 Tax=Echinicola marina TaxID=2859768 RepID=UPI001CF6B756|nr:polysaccharide pyruvyl transferase family protein [Echinicola marina]UCS92956.1 polysaccharide pyruvyl transferase family protein [Echinicola marina]